MELSLPNLIDEERLAALARVYLELRLPLKAALDAARADLVNVDSRLRPAAPSPPSGQTTLRCATS